MRSVRLLACMMIFALAVASPHIGAWVMTASASTGPSAAGQEAVNAPASDNESQEELCNSDNPRKQKKCHYNASDVVDDNDNDNPPPLLTAEVNNADPEEDDTITLTLHAWGNEIDQVWWWVPDELDDNGNDNEEFFNVAQVFSCGGSDDCWQTSELTPRHEGTFRIHAKARDSMGRETGELVTEVRVQDGDDD